MKQGSPEWIAHRRNFIGSSDAPVIMGVSPWRTRYQVWQEKLGLSIGQKENHAMSYGKKMEPIARKVYENYTGNVVSIDEEHTLAYHLEKKFMMASLDGFVMNKFIPLEIKTANAEDHFLAKNGQVPAKYYPQVQHQLACVNLDLLHYFSYRDGDFSLVEVGRDNAYINKLYFKEAEFWDLVLNLEAPELTDRDCIENKDPEWSKLAQEWIYLTNCLSALEEKQSNCKDALIIKSNGQNIKGDGIRLTKIKRKGSVDYRKIPELMKVDLEKYRKPPTEAWRIMTADGTTSTVNLKNTIYFSV